MLERIRALVEGELYGVLCTQGDEQRCGSLVVENRPKFADDMTRIEAITITGRVVRLEPGANFECWAQRLLECHPYLDAFPAAPTLGPSRRSQAY